MLQAWVGGSRAAPLPVAGPEGVGEVVGGFNAAYRIDSTYRTAHHGAAVANPAGFGGAAEVIAHGDPGQPCTDQSGIRLSHRLQGPRDRAVRRHGLFTQLHCRIQGG